ncbi:MAG TPA: hypothetical protein PKD61_22040, partial [Polyangiaceae bacterium]|nr:hypothetical protein [Polyangiaceae bacterium]
MKRASTAKIGAVVALAATVVGSAACKRQTASGADAGASASVTAPAPPKPNTPLPAAPPAAAPQSFADLAAKADPAVVFVKTLQEQRGRTGRRRVIGE